MASTFQPQGAQYSPWISRILLKIYSRIYHAEMNSQKTIWDPDETVNMEPANLTRICTLLQGGSGSTTLQGNMGFARYHVYAQEAISLPAHTAVEVTIGYSVNIQPDLMIHTFATASLRARKIWAMEIHEGGQRNRSSTLQLVNLASHEQKISKGTTLC